MSEKQLTYLIIGETPASQFIGWRLSLSGSFIILVSQFVSIDGLVSWKSKKLGANFYTPNVFAKTVQELNNGNIMISNFEIDVMIISSISLKSFAEQCECLDKLLNSNTVVFIASDFGVELEPHALKFLKKSCKCVLSLYCDVECRQLSLGSYALVNDDHCSTYIGNSYVTENFLDDTAALDNLANAQMELSMADSEFMVSKTSIMTNSLKMTTRWLSVRIVQDPKIMASVLWEFLIPKISLNILSIIYEQFDYEILLQNHSTETIFRDLVKELIVISKIQSGSYIDSYYNQTKNTIEFENIVNCYKIKRQNLINTTSNEYPEFLSLPFEPYCFYHKFEFPAHILLQQPINLAKKYGVPYSNLNFLYGFFSRLLALNGISISGGLLQKNASLIFIKDSNLSIQSSQKSKPNDQSKSKKDKKKDKKMSRKNHISFSLEENGIIGDRDSATMFSPGLENVYLNSGNITSMDNSFAQISSSAANVEFSSTAQEHYSSTQSSSSAFTNTSSSNDENPDDSDTIDGKTLNITAKKRHIQLKQKFIRSAYDDTSSFEMENRAKSYRWKEYSAKLDDMEMVDIPKFVSKFNNKPYINPMLMLGANKKISSVSNDGRPYTTDSLEFQVRNSCDILSKEYNTLRQQIFDMELSQRHAARDQQRKHFIKMELKLWKLQRKFNYYTGAVPRPRTGPYEDLLDHIELLNKGNTGDILKWTTSRYGEVDSYESISKDKEKIMALFDSNSLINKRLEDSGES